MSTSAHDILLQVYGYTHFRGNQQQIIEHVSAGKDAFVLMPTGGGKSMCYQIPALLRKGTGIVISPLIALMQDQVQALRQLAVEAAFLNSTQSLEQSQQVEHALLQGRLKLLYVSPERLLSARFLSLLERSSIALFAIDEAHCVSQWGHDFRPEYRQLAILHERWPATPRIALTATADPPTRAEIAERLGLTEATHFISSFDRPNICYSVVQKTDMRRQLLEFLQPHRGQSGIVYAMSRTRVERTAEYLQNMGFYALAYHAGLSHAIRTEHQRRFLHEEGIIMVATIAFGMGIDKPNVRFVAHIDLPKSLEGYYQETGRAGRDGEHADSWLCYGLQDVVLLRQMISQSEASQERKHTEYNKLDHLLGYCQSMLCRRKALLGYFSEAYTQSCQNCDNCLHPPAAWDATIAAQKILSCIYRTGQRFGAKHIIDVLMGRMTSRIKQLNHHNLSTFGIGREHDIHIWSSILRQLIASHALTTDPLHNGFILTHIGAKILKGQQQILARRETNSSTAHHLIRNTANPNVEDDKLLTALRALRTRLAKEQNIPSFVIFHDSTLREIAASRPRSIEDLTLISGIGQRKLSNYGARLLEVIHENDPSLAQS